MVVSGGSMKRERLLLAGTIARFTDRARLVPGSSRALGWDTLSRTRRPAPRRRATISRRRPGPTAFTGTSIWVGPERELSAVLLTNRVYPTREKTEIFRLRLAFHDAVIAALVEER